MLNLAVDYAALISGNLEAETNRVMLKDNVEIQVSFTKRCSVYCLFYILLNRIMIAATKIETILRNWSCHIEVSSEH
jgi:hypothetical protein